MPRVYNQYRGQVPIDAVYIGRPSPWGNPFKIGRDGSRNDVIIKHREWLKTQPELVERIKRELRGKDLVCFCAPNACHGETLIAIANE